MQRDGVIEAVQAAKARNTLADLSKVDLRTTNLSGIDLSHVDFGWANLSGADLRQAQVSSTNFSNANFQETLLDKKS